MNVLDAAITRVRNVFKNDCKIYLSFSSGKDSLCMASIVYDLIRAGEIDGTKLTVTFIDEEGLYPSMVEAAHRWRRNFLSAGAKFLWFCLPFKQVSVIDHLSSSESWITWEPGKEDVWMRKPPDFAIMYSPYLHYPGEMNYQTFCGKAFADGIQLVGLRTAESLTRLKCIANAKMERIVRGGKFYPIYDWRDSDVWLYIKQRDLEFPEIYMRLYEAGVRKNALRLCAFFGDCSTQGLRWVAETDARREAARQHPFGKSVRPCGARCCKYKNGGRTRQHQRRRTNPYGKRNQWCPEPHARRGKPAGRSRCRCKR